MSLDQDIREYILGAMPADSVRTQDIGTRPVSELLVDYLNWRGRAVSSSPRRVHVAPGLAAASASDETLRAFIDRLTAAVEAGHDLTVHLESASSSCYFGSPTEGCGRLQELDLILNRWRIHHLHTTDANGASTGRVVFAAFGAKDAYFIGAFDQMTWTSEEVAGVLIDTWPNSEFVRTLSPGNDLREGATDQTLSGLRDAGLEGSLVERRGELFLLGTGGEGSELSATSNRLRAKSILLGINALAKQVSKEHLRIRSRIASARKTDLVLKLEVRPQDTFVLRDANSGNEWALPRL
jgi:hypothetical protein